MLLIAILLIICNIAWSFHVTKTCINNKFNTKFSMTPPESDARDRKFPENKQEDALDKFRVTMDDDAMVFLPKYIGVFLT